MRMTIISKAWGVGAGGGEAPFLLASMSIRGVPVVEGEGKGALGIAGGCSGREVVMVMMMMVLTIVITLLKASSLVLTATGISRA
jgi:hypothetical protein